MTPALWTAVRRRVGRCALVLLASLASVGCLPRERINADCQWTSDAALTLPDDRNRRAHLREDVRVAKELGIRYADVSAGRMNRPEWSRALTWCTERSLAEIERVHGVSRAELTRVGASRELWIDLLVVMLPVAVLYAAVSRAIVARAFSDYGRDDRRMAAVVIALLTPIAGGVAVALAQMWGVVVEQLRMRNDHISYRAFDLPASRHGWLLWAIAIALFAGIGTLELLRERPVEERHRRLLR